ncbi:MAG: hypothetical protein ACQET5_03480 [Halobacteriota archaeon]|uniref:hypothetical protein n=1 Tax=Natronomonas sp. TaxID=2184060 RepID=UPI00397606C3
MDREWVYEFWPFLIGVAIIVVGNIYLYVLQGTDWRPGGLPFVVAIVVVLLIEAGRAAYRRFA